MGNNDNTYSVQITKELNKWSERVIYDVEFKKNTKANLNRLSDIMFNAFDKFTIIAASTESVVYKIGKFFITKNIKNEQITFIDGKIIETYIADDSKEWKKKENVDSFFEIFGKDCENKWVMIPYMDFEITPGLAIYFITQFKKAGAIGVIFYSAGPNNLAESLITNTKMPGLYQFPAVRYHSRHRKQLKEDEW